jgi:hypothetical protein
MDLDHFLSFPGAPALDITDGVLYFLPEAMSEYRKEQLTHAFRVRGWQWWLVSTDPQFLYNTDEGDHARDTVKAALESVGMRRGLDTVTELPNHADGSRWMVCPRDGIPPHSVETHELMHGANKHLVDDCMNRHFQDLMKGEDDGGVLEDVIEIPPDRGPVHTLLDDGVEPAAHLDAGLGEFQLPSAAGANSPQAEHAKTTLTTLT